MKLIKTILAIIGTLIGASIILGVIITISHDIYSKANLQWKEWLFVIGGVAGFVLFGGWIIWSVDYIFSKNWKKNAD